MSRFLRPVLSLLVTLACLGGLLALAPAPAGAVTAAGYASSARHWTNVVRKNHDRVELTKTACLQKLAVRQAKKMANQKAIFHQDLQNVLDTCHLSFVGENVAMGYPSGKAVVKNGWMKSPPHRANILEKSFRQTGLAAVQAGGVWYVSQLFGKK